MLSHKMSTPRRGTQLAIWEQIEKCSIVTAVQLGLNTHPIELAAWVITDMSSATASGHTSGEACAVCEVDVGEGSRFESK
jgi:hypothetical protein